MITLLDEDLFVTAFLAMQDSISMRKRRDFFWKPVIGHNNYALNRLVEKGVAENHFHLNGSAPMFHLSWLSLMNHIANSDFERTYLPKEILLESCKEEQRDRLEEEFFKRKNSRDEKFALEDYRDAFDEPTKKKLKSDYAYRRINELLRDARKLDASLGIIQKNIDRMKRLYGRSIYGRYDYAICEQWLCGRKEEQFRNDVLAGERWLLYSIFTYVYENREDWKKVFKLVLFISGCKSKHSK